MQDWYPAIIGALFGINIALISWTFNRTDQRVGRISGDVGRLITDVAVIKALLAQRGYPVAPPKD